MMSPQARMYKIMLPAGAKAEDFVSFMSKEVFTAVDTGPSRAVNVSAQRLFYNAHAQNNIFGWSSTNTISANLLKKWA